MRESHPISGDQPPAESVAGVVLQATRRSADLSPRELAEALQLAEEAVRAWENGVEPLASAPISQLDALIAVLRAADADPELVADIDAAVWCDIVLTSTANKEDISCLLADPLASSQNFADLLDWATMGTIPARYSQYASAMPGRRIDA